MNRYQEIGKIVVIYALFGGAWIYFSDTALGWLVRDPKIMTKLAMFKGLLFITCTSILLYFLIARLSGKIRQSTEALRANEERFRLAMEATSDALWDWDLQSGAVYLSPRYYQLTGQPADIHPANIGFLKNTIHPEDLSSVLTAVEEHRRGMTSTIEFDYRLSLPSEEIRWLRVKGQAVERDAAGSPLRMVGTLSDITQYKQNEESKFKLESQLQQVHKMEAIGQLAGGVAHDFNNMLGVIMGHAEMAMDLTDPSHPVFTDLQEIQDAAQRSAEITRQLLAFARRQTILPKLIDLNTTVEGMLKMLRRLIGEDIDLVFLPSADLWQVKVDPSQIDQILANLCLNARDSLAGVGKIVVETGNRVFNEEYCTTHPDAFVGEYVMLAVSDTGCGMDKQTQAHIFEPFFTTKDIGEGTGLGLATVYGAVRQNNGFINIYSEPDRGTTFRIYLPRYASNTEQAWTMDTSEPAVGGHENILLVEDEPAILNMTSEMLQRLGYSVMAVNMPTDARRLAEEFPTGIHLLITDVIMPEMNGRDLAKQLLASRPEMKCLFMSGYTANIIANQGVLDDGVNFIQKPFSKKEMAAKIREVLDS